MLERIFELGQISGQVIYRVAVSAFTVDARGSHSSPAPHHTSVTVVARMATTTLELRGVLGKTFHAHSWAAQIMYCRAGWMPLLQSRKGLDHAKYA